MAAGLLKVRFVRDFGRRKAGAIVECDAVKAAHYVGSGVASYDLEAPVKRRKRLGSGAETDAPTDEAESEWPS